MNEKDWKEFLPPGWGVKLADKHGVSQGFVSLVVHGHRKNNNILNDAISLAEKEKEHRREEQSAEEKRRERIAKLTA